MTIRNVAFLSQNETDLSALEMFERRHSARDSIIKSTSSSSDFESLGNLDWDSVSAISALNCMF